MDEIVDEIADVPTPADDHRAVRCASSVPGYRGQIQNAGRYTGPRPTPFRAETARPRSPRGRCGRTCVATTCAFTVAFASEPAVHGALGIDAIGEHDGRAPHVVVVVHRRADERGVSPGAESVERAPRPPSATSRSRPCGQAPIRRDLRGAARSVSMSRWNLRWRVTARLDRASRLRATSGNIRSCAPQLAHVPLASTPFATACTIHCRHALLDAHAGGRSPRRAAREIRARLQGPDPERATRCRSEIGGGSGPTRIDALDEDRPREARFGAGANGSAVARVSPGRVSTRACSWAFPSEPAACRALGIDAVEERDGSAPHGVVVVRRPAD